MCVCVCEGGMRRLIWKLQCFGKCIVFMVALLPVYAMHGVGVSRACSPPLPLRLSPRAVRRGIVPGRTKLVLVESPTNPRMQVGAGRVTRHPSIAVDSLYLSFAWAKLVHSIYAAPLHDHVVPVQICDIKAICDIARAAGAICCVDNR